MANIIKAAMDYAITSFSKLDFLTEGKYLDLDRFFFLLLFPFWVFFLYLFIYLIGGGRPKASKRNLNFQGAINRVQY